MIWIQYDEDFSTVVFNGKIGFCRQKELFRPQQDVLLAGVLAFKILLKVCVCLFLN